MQKMSVNMLVIGSERTAKAETSSTFLKDSPTPGPCESVYKSVDIRLEDETFFGYTHPVKLKFLKLLKRSRE